MDKRIKKITEEADEISRSINQLQMHITSLINRRETLIDQAQELCEHPFDDLVRVEWGDFKCPHCNIIGRVNVALNGKRLVGYPGWLTKK